LRVAARSKRDIRALRSSGIVDAHTLTVRPPSLTDGTRRGNQTGMIRSIVGVVLVVGCASPSTAAMSCPASLMNCAGVCIDPSTEVCCDDHFFESPVICTKDGLEYCAGNCFPYPWLSIVECGRREHWVGSYYTVGATGATMQTYDLEFTCVHDSAGSVTVSFDGTSHAATWTAIRNLDGPFMIEGAGFARITMYVTEVRTTSFDASVIDGNGTNAVTFMWAP
jgi:hypothetical protein